MGSVGADKTVHRFEFLFGTVETSGAVYCGSGICVV